jgi:glycosidase
VDGFRFDMAEMVPVEFWSYMNSAIKNANPDAFLLAEVYNPAMYRAYLHLGKMDYLYDKVELYDTLKNIIQGHGSADNLVAIQAGLADIEHHMLHFLENHDEQRLPSPPFAGNAVKGKPAMVLSATISTAPTMIYFGQEVGEPGEGDAGFGSTSRTTIFDYWGVPAHQRWMNGGAFDGGQLSNEEKDLRDFYKRLLNFTLKSSALMGNYQELHSYNRANSQGYYEKGFSFARWSEDEHLLVLVNFKDWVTDEYELQIPADLISKWKLKDGNYKLADQLYGVEVPDLVVAGGKGKVKISLKPLESLVLKVEI